jgi:hypothetical protein
MNLINPEWHNYIYLYEAANRHDQISAHPASWETLVTTTHDLEHISLKFLLK